MVDFHPLDLGTSSSTEFEPKDLAKILKTNFAENPKLKKCTMGLIHSHHNMRAYFSSTDTETLHEHAPEKGFYCSLVVSKAVPKKAFAISWQDQYGFTNYYECDNSDIQKPIIPINSKWEAIAEDIATKKKNAKAVLPYKYNHKQGALWESKPKSEEILAEIESKAFEAYGKYDLGELSYTELVTYLKRIGIDKPYSWLFEQGLFKDDYDYRSGYGY